MERLFLRDGDVHSDEFQRKFDSPCEMHLGLVSNADLRSEAPKSVVIPDWEKLYDLVK